MKLRLALLLLIAAGVLSAANPPAYISAGVMRCGATRRGATDVQIWCYTGLVFSATTYLRNLLISVPIGSVAIDRLEYNGTDTIEWTLTQGSDGVMNYSVTANGSVPVTGEL
jgi:hypothetical protein